ncbi:hypothetical protein GCM10017688_46480 [Streptomyces ramulosus]
MPWTAASTAAPTPAPMAACVAMDRSNAVIRFRMNSRTSVYSKLRPSITSGPRKKLRNAMAACIAMSAMA